MDINFENSKIGVIGSGSFGTAIVKILTDNNNSIYWNVVDEKTEVYIKLNHHNPEFNSTIDFNLNQLTVTSNINEVIENCDILIFATPSIYLKNSIDKINNTSLLKNKLIVSVIKGIVPEFNDIVGHYFHKILNVPYENISVIIGPCHAEEIAMERLSYLTVASIKQDNAKLISKLISCKYIKTSISDDIFGTEYSAVLKNIFAISAGIAHGLGYGDNFQAVLLSNAIREIERFLNVVYPIQRDIKNSAYLGDLLVTSYSMFSRNRTLGNMIGKGYTVKNAILEMNMIAEGYFATQGIHKISQDKNIEMPICKATNDILFNEKDAKNTFEKLSELFD